MDKSVYGIPMSKLGATIVRKASSRMAKFFSPVALASDGENLYVHSWLRFYNDVGGRLTEVADSDAQSHADGLVVHEGELFACGGDGLISSTDGGETWSAVSVPTKESLRRIAVDREGGIWVGGGYHGGGVVVYRAPNAKSFKMVKGPADFVTAMVTTSKGVLVGDRKGDIWQGVAGKLQKLHSATASIRALLETSEGTFVAFGATEDEWESGVLLRSNDGGKKFTSTPQPNFQEWIFVLGEVPGGPIIGGGDECALVSEDDGKTFQKLRQNITAPCQQFTAVCVHGDALMLGGSENHLVELRVGAAKKKPAKKSAATKKPAKRKAAAKKGPAKKSAAKTKPAKKRAAKKKRS